jgi:hypothetical protein
MRIYVKNLVSVEEWQLRYSVGFRLLQISEYQIINSTSRKSMNYASLFQTPKDKFLFSSHGNLAVSGYIIVL